jgi:hypothetical protein
MNVWQYTSMIASAMPLLGTLAVLALLALGIVLLARGNRAGKQSGGRVIIHPAVRERVRLYAAGIRGKNCKGCRQKLFDGSPLAHCERDASHQIHRECVELVQGKCPDCRGNLI